MNSPTEPASPSPSTPSSESPPPEETNPQPTSVASPLMNLASQISSTFSGGSSKRRLPGSGYGASSSARDPKSRRRGDVGRHGMAGGGSSVWDTKEAKREKDELVDSNLVDYLRKEIGDPFQEDLLKEST